MTLQELNNEFDIHYNSIAGQSAPNLDAYEKSIFLTKAQLEIIKNYFVHIEELYKILNKNNSGLIKVTMGNFDRPVTKYLLVIDGKISYYQGNPLPTSSNIEADKKLKEILSK